MASSLKQPLILRSFDLVTIALLLLWSLSPLATQALQRMSFPSEMYTNATATVWFLDTSIRNVAFGSLGPGVPYSSVISRFFEASTLPPGQYQQAYQDPWLRPKIPIIELLDNYTSDPYEWIDASSAVDVMDFSSNYGIPLDEPPLGEAESYFNVSSSYLHFNCSPFSQISLSQIKSARTSLLPVVAIEGQIYNESYMRIVPQDQSNLGQVIYATVAYTDGHPILSSPDVDNSEYMQTTCSFSQTFVDSKMHCLSTGSVSQNVSSSDYAPTNNECFVSAMRNTIPTPDRTQMIDFTDSFIGAAGPLVNSYLYNPKNMTDYGLSGGSRPIYELSNFDFTSRLSLLINTYWQLGFGPTVQDSGLYHATAELYGYNVQNRTAVVLSSYPVSGISIGWLSVLFICSTVLLLASIMSMIMDAHTIVPDMLGYASTLARKSKYVDLPKVNSSMSGAERARKLGDHRVMMQDVKPDAPVGRVALGKATPEAKRLEKGRDYR